MYKVQGLNKGEQTIAGAILQAVMQKMGLQLSYRIDGRQWRDGSARRSGLIRSQGRNDDGFPPGLKYCFIQRNVLGFIAQK